MTRYRLNALGDVEFENMVQSLLKRVIGPGTTTFGAGKDGAREATFTGEAAYPSPVDRWSGNWIFQAKFHDIDLVGTGPARSSVIADIDSELNKLTTKYQYKVDNYILVTNVPLSGVYRRGTLDRIEDEIFGKYRSKIPHLAIWGADDVNRFLDLYPDVRRPYVDLLISGDVIAQLLTQAEQARTEIAITLDMYLRDTFSREGNAQLDQAGDTSEDQVPLHRVFFDLEAYIPYYAQEAMERYTKRTVPARSLPIGGPGGVQMVRYLVNQGAPDRVVIVGGPGEGKSTIGQYLAQLHRAALLNKHEEMDVPSDYVPEILRLPFRVVLKDFAQWLADSSAESVETANLDAYLAGQIARITKRPFSEKDLHEILKTNPAVLILDGLDEVTESGLRKRLLARLLEFAERAQNTLHSDLQVIATTRPTNYSDQFDPKTFLHFRLHKLQAKQVRNYVDKWIAVRVLDEDKAGRLRKTIEECLVDKQVSLLMNTPLQVTILILIINSGGTPPRQREALFNEYLEVIYKREKAKGLGIVKTEKELLIGLHKLVGYLLHEEATKGRASSARLARTDYDTIVMSYLRDHDPYSPEEEIRKEWRTLTVDAGERLVLIVESPADVFGFELRSIQEFFAACYLCDTSRDTDERYRRFARIAPLSHWRNVALFFAGRVGRNYTGEAANIVEVCKDIDREGPDLYIRRGAEIALELATERALGPDRRLQRSLLEHGLTIFDTPLSFKARQAAIDLVSRLPYEDIRDHVLPIMEQRLSSLGYVAIMNCCHLLGMVAPDSQVLAKNIIRIAAEAGQAFAGEILTVVGNAIVPRELRMSVIRSLLDADVKSSTIGAWLASAEWPALCRMVAELDSQDMISVRHSFAVSAAINATYSSRTAERGAIPESESSLALLLQCAKAVGAVLPLGRTILNARVVSRLEEVWKNEASGLPEDVLEGNFDRFSNLGDACWLPWLTHLTYGNVSNETWVKFSEWFSAYRFDEPTADAWSYITRPLSPIASLVDPSGASGDVGGLAGIAVEFGGRSGFIRWLERVERLRGGLRWLSGGDLRKLSVYGPEFLAQRARERVVQTLDDLFDARLHPIACNFLEDPRSSLRLTGAEYDRLADWIAGLPRDSQWRRSSLADAICAWTVVLKKANSPQFEACSAYISRNTLANLMVDAILEGDGQAVKILLLKLAANGVGDPSRPYSPVMVSPNKRRQIIIHLALLAGDADPGIHYQILELLTELCLTVREEHARRSAIRSRELDSVHARLIASSDSRERAAGISLYAVRPPRSAAEWGEFKELLKSSTADEVSDYWSWVLVFSADLSTSIDMWIETIMSVLRDGVGGPFELILADVLRGVLARENQSISPVAGDLSLPIVDIRSL